MAEARESEGLSFSRDHCAPRRLPIHKTLQSAVGHWWRGGDRFDWFSMYLKGRDLQRVWRIGVAGCTALLAAIPVVALSRPVIHRETILVATSYAISAMGAVLALLWLIRWPTRTQSIFFCLLADACVTAACLLPGDPRLALLGCTSFAVLGGYIGFFHSARCMLLNFSIATTTAVILTVRLARSYDMVLAGCALAFVMVLFVAVPFVMQSLINALNMDLKRSSLDPLTGLLNRRAFYEAAESMLRNRRGGQLHFGVALIDLDKFKRLNDVYGHFAGDQALAQIGEVLRDNAGPGAVVGRLGGEEFVVADTADNNALKAVAERLRLTIEATPHGVTASIGAACAPMLEASEFPERQIIDALVRGADAAMYEAKSAGGNQVRIVGHGAFSEPADFRGTEDGRRADRA